MKIELNNDTFFSTALQLADEGEYFDALCLFARVDSYESLLNQIGCFCMLNDLGYAIDAYRKLIARYGFTHNCYMDVLQLGDAVNEIFEYFGNRPRGDYAERLDTRISADAESMSLYTFQMEEDEDDFELDFLEHSVPIEKGKSVFYDVKSVDYFNSVRDRMAEGFFQSDLDMVNKAQKEYLAIETDDVPTLELQLYLCYTRHIWDKGEKCALRLLNAEDPGFRATGTAVRILDQVGGREKELKQLLSKLPRYGENITDPDMMEYLQIACKLGYDEVTKSLCDVLYSHYLDAGCDALRMCAVVYCNCHEYELAREATLLLCRALPDSGVAKALLAFINEKIPIPLDDPSGVNSLARHFFLPDQLTAVAQFLLISKLDENKYHLGKQDFHHLDCMIRECSSCILKGDVEKYIKGATALGAVMATFTPENTDDFLLFAKQCIASVLPEVGISRAILMKMIQLGCADKVTVSISQGFYALNLAQLTLRDDEMFVEAFSLCATLKKVEPRRMEKTYRFVAKNSDLAKMPLDVAVRQTAFALLALTNKKFAESKEADYFSEEERELYRNLKDLSDN